MYSLFKGALLLFSSLFANTMLRIVKNVSSNSLLSL